MGRVAALWGRWRSRHRDLDHPAARGPDAELLAGVALSAHAVRRFVERGPGVPRGRSPEAALTDLVLRGHPVDRPPKWFSGRRAGSAFFIVVEERWVLPVALGRPSGIARRGMRPWVATTFVGRREAPDARPGRDPPAPRRRPTPRGPIR